MSNRPGNTVRWIIRAMLLGCVVVIALYVSRHVYWDEIKTPIRLNQEAQADPLYVLKKLTGQLGIDLHTIHQSTELPADRATVLYLSNWDFSLLPERQERIKHWVAQGGRLVIDDSVYGREAVTAWLGIDVEQLEQESATENDNGNDADAESDDDTSVAEDDSSTVCPTLTTGGYSPNLAAASTLMVCGFAEDFRLVTDQPIRWQVSNQAGLQVVTVPMKKGWVTVINGEPFNNSSLLSDDHALLLAAAAQWQRGDQFYLLSEADSPSLPALIWQYGWPLVLFTLLWVALWLWRQMTRLGSLRTEPSAPRRSLREQIRGASVFMWRQGTLEALRQSCIHALHSAASTAIPHYSRLDSQAKLQAIARHTQLPADDLANAVNQASPKRVQALRAMAFIEQARRALMRKSPSSLPAQHMK